LMEEVLNWTRNITEPPFERGGKLSSPELNLKKTLRRIEITENEKGTVETETSPMINCHPRCRIGGGGKLCRMDEYT